MTIHMNHKVYQRDTADTADTAPKIYMKQRFMLM